MVLSVGRVQTASPGSALASPRVRQCQSQTCPEAKAPIHSITPGQVYTGVRATTLGWPGSSGEASVWPACLKVCPQAAHYCQGLRDIWNGLVRGATPSLSRKVLLSQGTLASVLTDFP